MNVNLTPPIEPGKVTTVGKNGTVGAEVAEAESSGGFFAQLQALIFGSKTTSDETTSVKASAANAEGDTAEDALIDSEDGSLSTAKTTQTDDVAQADQVLASAADTDLLSEAELSEAELQAEQKMPPQAKGEITSAKVAQESEADETSTAAVPASIAKWVAKQEPASDEAVNHELQRKTAQAMSDGDQLLGRLQEANQALSKSNGKTLPVQHGQALDQHSADLAATKGELEPTLPFDSQHQLSAEAAVPAVNPQDEASDAANEGDSNQDELMAAALLGGAITSATVAQGDPSAAAVQEMAVDPASALVKPEAALMSDELAMKGKPARLAQSAQIPMSVSAQAIGDALNSSTVGSGKVAIPWATQVPTDAELASLPPELKELLAEGGKTKAQAVNPQVQSLAQGVTPAHLAAQQAATTTVPINPTAATPIDMAALTPQAVAVNPMVNPASTVNPELAASSAMLAALSGRALAGGDERRATNDSGHEGLAQQIAAAAGQGVGQNQALHRAESQAVQNSATPLHLNKEMAADQLAERIQVMMSKNLKNIDIRLDPPEMGRMHIRMNMQGDGATVHFTVANQHARDALEQTMPRLREMLAQQGVQLGDTSVQQQSAGQQQRYSGQEQSGFGQTARNEKHNSEENLDTDVKLDLNVATKRDGISYYA
ncbi:flagellar hook-length control protein FliK [Vibrio sp. RC586]|uniref:flagellar hook-length control protein FliK n=1 Tax=Vibrio sp. RC586 TaxID=675815 RepID=UPI0001BB8150|nr:flagellar hook-length control protein FliK [Vibrio sp. RC586]EEY98644.1 flagellar hook-length control protein FliK [Vibrio sp. RC586]